MELLLEREHPKHRQFPDIFMPNSDRVARLEGMGTEGFGMAGMERPQTISSAAATAFRPQGEALQKQRPSV